MEEEYAKFLDKEQQEILAKKRAEEEEQRRKNNLVTNLLGQFPNMNYDQARNELERDNYNINISANRLYQKLEQDR